MALEFVVPVHTADIELERADRFFVQELHDVEGLAPSSQEELLDGTQSRLDVRFNFHN